MTIIEKAPCRISLNTHGGAVIDVGFAVISSCVGGWAFHLQSDPGQRMDDLYCNIASAYVAAMRAFNEEFKNVIPVTTKKPDEVVDRWL